MNQERRLTASSMMETHSSQVFFLRANQLKLVYNGGGSGTQSTSEMK